VIVISNTSPLNYLVLIEQADCLSALFTGIFIPKAVYDELGDQAAPDAVRNWINQQPNWLSVREINNKQYDAELASLDPGEREVIILAEEISASLVILDEYKARQIAERRGLRVTGTLGGVECRRATQFTECAGNS
jgi:predicted nucleic acid-binding protein